MTRLLFEGVCRRFGGVAAVDEAALRLDPGVWTGVLGPPGAGKTTLGRVIAGLERPDRGDVFFDGQLVDPSSRARRDLGYLPQSEALLPHLGVAGNVEYPLRARGAPRQERRRRVVEALERIGIEGLDGARIADLDGLQRRKVELARAIVEDPPLLILDEPTGPLEPRHRGSFREDLRRLGSVGERTVLLLTRDRDDALGLSDRLAVMDLGKIVQEGPPAEVYARPTDAFVAQLLGPTNLLQGQIVGADSRGEVFIRTTIGRLVGRLSDPVNRAAPNGTPVTVSIRPEAIAIGPAFPADANRFPAVFERQRFQGATQAVELRGPGDWPLHATLLAPGAPRLREGQSVTAAVAPEHVVVLLGRYAGAGWRSEAAIESAVAST